VVGEGEGRKGYGVGRGGIVNYRWGGRVEERGIQRGPRDRKKNGSSGNKMATFRG
jgi:hypothetical protein